MASAVSKILHYRHASFLIPAPLSLEDALKVAFANAPLPMNRKRETNAEGAHVLNSAGTIGNTWCGMVHRWQGGQSSLVVEQDPKATVWSVTPSAPPAPKNQGSKVDFVEATIYFGVRKNHVVLVQPALMRDSELADYLSWLLKTHASQALGGNSAVHVTLKPASPTKLRAAGVHKAKAIRIKLPMAKKVMRQPVKGDGHRKPYEVKVVDEERAEGTRTVLNALGVPVPASIFGNAEATELDVELRITIPGGNSDELSNSVMNEIGSLVAQHTSDAYSVVMPDGIVIQGGTLKLAKEVNLPVSDGSTYPSPQAIFTAIDAYLQHLITASAV